MPLFVAQHRHLPRACPAAPESAALLLEHVSAATAARFGVTIQAEAVIDGEHGLILIVEAPDRRHAEEFVAIFTHWGEVQILAASSAEEAVSRGGCGFENPAGRSSQGCEGSPARGV